MKLSTYLLLTGGASAVKITHKTAAEAALVDDDHFMLNPINVMLACDKLQHDFKLSWDELHQCVNDAHMRQTTFEGYGLTEHQVQLFHDDFMAHDANGDGLVDVYELNQFISNKGEPCPSPDGVMFAGLCMVDGGADGEDGESGTNTHIEVTYAQHAGFCVDGGDDLTALEFIGDGVSLNDCVTKCAVQLFDGVSGCTAAEHHPAGGAVTDFEPHNDRACPADYPFCYSDGDCITEAYQQCIEDHPSNYHEIDGCGHWYHNVNFIVGIENDHEGPKCHVSPPSPPVFTKEGHNDSCYLAMATPTAGGYTGSKGAPAFEAYCYVPDIAGATTTVTDI